RRPAIRRSRPALGARPHHRSPLGVLPRPARAHRHSGASVAHDRPSGLGCERERRSRRRAAREQPAARAGEPPQERVPGVGQSRGPYADEKGLEVRALIPLGLPNVWADRARVRQVLANMLANAVKFTERGTVSVGATAAEGWVTVSVSDTGVGISPEAQAYVFDEFR